MAMTYKAFNKFLDDHFTRAFVVAAVLLIAIALFMGKMNGTELTAALGLIFSGYVAKRGNEAYQERKTAEVTGEVKPNVSKS